MALSLLLVLFSVAVASAQVRVNNDKAERKAERKAARLNQQQAQRSAVVENNGVIDRSRVHSDGSDRRSTVHRNANGNGYYYDRYGNRVYDYRNNRVDPFYNYPQYRRNNGYYGSYPNGYYGNSNPYYYDNREGSRDRGDVSRSAAQTGYYEGFQRGQYDAQQRNRPNPYGHGAYQFGYDGFDPSWGSASTYQQTYRQYFIQGYNDGYSQRGYTSRYPQRRG
jgi:hypothetical protein